MELKLRHYLRIEQDDYMWEKLVWLGIFEDKSYFTVGADAIIGIEYRWLSVPCTIGFDVKPYFNFIGLRYTQYRFWDSAVTFKYVF